jgi:peptide methionine sulfoxide reductase MsrA
LSDKQKQEAEEVVGELTNSHTFGAPIITEITKAGPFYHAEEYHQKFFKKTGYGACHIWPKDVDIHS